MILLFFSSLYSCTSNKWSKNIQDKKFRDDVIFLNMELLANSYTYDFRTKTYELSVKSTYEIDFRDLVIEKGYTVSQLLTACNVTKINQIKDIQSAFNAVSSWANATKTMER